MNAAFYYKLQEHSTEVHNSRRPLARLTLTVTLIIGKRGIVTVIDYLYAKFGDFSFSRFGFIMRTHRQNHTLRPMIAVLRRIPSASVITSKWRRRADQGHGLQQSQRMKFRHQPSSKLLSHCIRVSQSLTNMLPRTTPRIHQTLLPGRVCTDLR